MYNSMTYKAYKACIKEIQASVVYKLILGLYFLLVKAWEQSFICSLVYKDDGNVVAYIKQSTGYYSCNRFMGSLSNLGTGLKVRDSYLLKLMDKLYLFFRGSPKVFGVLGLSFAIISLILLFIKGNIQSTRGLVVFLICIVSLICIFLSKDIIKEIKESYLIGLVLRGFNISLLSKREENVVFYLIAVIIGVGLAGVFALLPLRLSLLVMTAIPVVILVLNKRQYGILMTIFFLPILPTMFVLGLIGLVLVAVILDCLKGEVKFELKSLDISVILFLVSMLASTVISFHIKSSIMVVGTYIIFLALYTAIRITKVEIPQYLWAVAVSGLIVALYGIYQFITGNVSKENAWVDTEMFSGMVRVYSTLGNPNVLGIFLIISITLTAGLLWISKTRYTRVLVGILLVPQIGCMVLTYSRGAWLGLAAATFIVVLFNLRCLFFPALGLGIVTIILMPARVIDRFLSIGNTLDSSTSYRISIWENSIKVIQDFWITGIGFGTDSFNRVYNYYAGHVVPTQHSHNLFLHIIMSLGILGFLIFMVMMIQTCFALVKNTRLKDCKSLSVFLLAAIIGILVQGLTDNIWYNYRIVGIFWVLMAVSHVLCYNKENIL